MDRLGSGVDGAARSVTWKYNSAGRTTYLTTHSDATPDTTTWTDAVTQVKNTYDAAGYLTMQEQEPDGKVDGSTLAVDLNYATDYSTGNYKRLANVEYPDGTKIWRGYTHSDTSGTFQDTINDVFSRVGQLAFDDNGSKGDLLVQYDFNGSGRFVRRSHSSDSGWAGNDTRTDLWGGSSGAYTGLDRFGRTVDLGMVDYSGTPVDFDRRKYSYDRNANPTSIENTVYKSRSLDLSYDNLDRLTQADEGILLSGAVVKSDLTRKYEMDLLGNLVAGTNGLGGFKQNSTSATFTHAVNATNEITEIARSNPAGAARVVNDTFTSSLSAMWTETHGDWGIASDQLKVVAMPGGNPAIPVAMLTGSAVVDDGTYEVKITLDDAGDYAGIMFDQGTEANAVVLKTGTTDNVLLTSISSGGIMPQNPLATASATINADTQYLVRVRRAQRRVEFEVWNAAGSTRLCAGSYNYTGDLGDGTFGLFSYQADVLFDEFTFTRIDQINPAAPRWSASASATLVSGALEVKTPDRGGVTRLEWAGDDAYMIQAEVNPNGGAWAELVFRYQDPDNYYSAFINTNAVSSNGYGDVEVRKVIKGSQSTVAADIYPIPQSWPVAIKVKVTTADEASVWIEGTPEISTAGVSELAAGGVGLAGEKAQFDDFKVGYDNNADDDIEDAGDDLVVSDAFGGTTITPTYDDNGNLTFDGTYKYTYDAWNRLVKATLDDTDVTIQTARYDGQGRRVRKVVSNSGDLDGTTVYYYQDWQIIETRDGSGNLTMQVYHGTRYIDEVVGLKLKDRGRVYVHQDANWNVTDLTDITGRVLERYYYDPYGSPEVVVDAHPFDWDDDGDVDETDTDACKSGGDCYGDYSGDCRRLDADADRDIDDDDFDIVSAYADSLPSSTALQRVPAATRSVLGNTFFHQGLVLDAELGSYQNRHRQFAPKLQRFMQSDPFGFQQAFDTDKHYEDGMSLYQYSGLDPIAHLDPYGLSLYINWDCVKTTLKGLFCKDLIHLAFCSTAYGLCVGLPSKATCGAAAACLGYEAGMVWLLCTVDAP